MAVLLSFELRGALRRGVKKQKNRIAQMWSVWLFPFFILPGYSTIKPPLLGADTCCVGTVF